MPMPWADFGPYVLPFVVGCPDPVLAHHARLTAIEFARSTQCWTQILEPAQCNGLDTLIEMDTPAHARISRVLSVAVGDLPWPLVEASHGHARLLNRGASDQFAFMDSDDATMHISPVQDRGSRVNVRASLVPTLNAPALPDALLEFADDMAQGIIEKIMLLPGQPLSNPNQAAVHGMRYQDRIKTIAAKVSRGRVAAHLRGKPGFI